MNTSAVRSRRQANGRFTAGRRGQSTIEYILIIGLIIITLIVALFVFRDSVGSFVQKIATWFDALGGKEEVPPPPEPPDPLDALVGTWCYWVNPDGSETADKGRLSVSRSKSNDMVWNYNSTTADGPKSDSIRVKSDGPDTFHIEGGNAEPNSFRMNPDGSITRTSNQDNPVVLRRC